MNLAKNQNTHTHTLTLSACPVGVHNWDRDCKWHAPRAGLHDGHLDKQLGKRPYVQSSQLDEGCVTATTQSTTGTTRVLFRLGVKDPHPPALRWYHCQLLRDGSAMVAHGNPSYHISRSFPHRFPSMPSYLLPASLRNLVLQLENAHKMSPTWRKGFGKHRVP